MLESQPVYQRGPAPLSHQALKVQKIPDSIVLIDLCLLMRWHVLTVNSDQGLRWAVLEWGNQSEKRSTSAPRKAYSAELKSKVVIEALRGFHTINTLAAQYGAYLHQISVWKAQLLVAALGCSQDEPTSRRKWQRHS
jgi:hypothetical protein